MSTVTEEVKPEDGKPESEKKIFYCEVCKVPCMSSISLQSHYRGAKHRKKEKALRPKTVYCPSAPVRTPMKYETQRPVKRGLTKDITCLKDFMNDPKREEPLVGLEHVVEIRFEGRKEPHYECKLCGFNTEMAPMIEHLSGYKHRRAYISKEFPDKMKRKTTDVKECKVSFLRRIAGELEKTEGLKMYKIEGYIRPSTSPPSKKKARWEDDYKRENDPVRKQKALEFLETFHITSDSEATLVVHITQELTEALKAFCEKKAAVNYTNSLRPLMSISQGEFSGRKSIPKHYKPYGKPKGSNWNQGFLSQYEERSADASSAPANSYGYQIDDGSSSCELRSNDFAMKSALRDSFALQTGSPASGISEWLRQFSRSASGSNSAGGASSYETSPVSEYSAEYMSNDVHGNKIPVNRVSYGGESTNWRNQQACSKARSVSDQGLPYPNSSASYPSSGRYPTNYPSQSYSSYGNAEPVNTCTSANTAPSGRGGSRWSEDSRWNENSRWDENSRWNQSSSWNQESSWSKESSWSQESRCQGFRHQKSGYRSDWGSHQYSFSGSGSYRDYQQFRSSDKMFDEDAVGLTPNILNRLRGKDIPTMTRMLKQLAPYYPALQKLNIQTLVNVLVETRGKD
uniref:C2H2-type domain-containing protein n=1 Tax=Calidris pygmaea TaxID=425635 RepID=A0A8C3JBX6_9CHAR